MKFFRGILLCLYILPQGAAILSFNNEVGKKKTLIVFSAPSIWDTIYHDRFLCLIDFQIRAAKAVMGKENVVILADRHTMPFLDGRSHKIRERMPFDTLLEANIYDIDIHDFAPMGLRNFVKFYYQPEGLDPFAANQVHKRRHSSVVSRRRSSWSKQYI